MFGAVDFMTFLSLSSKLRMHVPDDRIMATVRLVHDPVFPSISNPLTVDRVKYGADKCTTRDRGTASRPTERDILSPAKNELAQV